MERLNYILKTATPAKGSRRQAITGVVASGNLEVLAERVLPSDTCTVDIATATHGFAAIWEAVFSDFVARHQAGGLRLSINDGGARPDMVALRLAQVVRLIEEPEA